MFGFIALGTTAWFKAKPFFAEISRMRGAPFYTDSSFVRNHYQLRLLNKRNQPVEFSLSLDQAPEGFTLSGTDGTITLGALAETSRALVIINDNGHYTGPKELTLEIRAQPGNQTIRQKLKFLGPNPNQIRKP